MTMLLAHPEAETLARFVEGTLDDSERAAIVQHIADCDDCRILVVDAAEFESQSEVATHKWGVGRWLATAACVVFVVSIGSFSNHEYRENAAGREIHLVDDAARFASDCLDTSIHDAEWLLKRLPGFASTNTDRLVKVKEDYGKLGKRPLEARLSDFPYAPHHTMRSGNEEEADVATLTLQGDAAGVAELRGDDPETLHARGIGLLLAGSVAESIGPLQQAATREPKNVKYQSDLAAALVTSARGDRTILGHALAACDLALRIDPRSPDALFNRAVALETLTRPEALAAYERYLTVDSTSAWAKEARDHVEILSPLP